MLTYYSDSRLDCFELKKCHNVKHSEKAHFHTEISIILIENSSTYVTTDNEMEYEFTKDTFIVIPPYRTHNCIPTSKHDFKFTMLYLSSAWFEKTFQINLKNREIKSYKLKKSDIESIKNYFLIFQSEISDVKKELLLIKFIECFVLNKTGLISKNNISFEKNKLELVKKYLSENYTEKISLDKLSEISGLSKYHLTRSFKSEYQLSPLNYQKSIKFNYAKSQLQDKDCDISDLALELGYYDQSHFANEFKKFSGVSPNIYKKSNSK